jgi:type I restriction enzyme S subunit
MTDELPTGWAETTLQQSGAWRSGGTPSRRRPEFFGKGIRWVKSGDLPDGPILNTEEEITALGLENSSAKLMPAGTISMALYGATIGKLGIMTFPAATNQACANVIPDHRLVESNYLFYYLLSERRNFIKKGQGGAQPNISQEIVRMHPLRLAPLTEQHRIVAKLEKLLGQVGTCQERLSKVPALLKRFRQSVLAAACSGRLTADWREENSSLETAAVLFAKIKTERQRHYEKECRQAVAVGRRKPKHSDSNERSRNSVSDFPDIPETWAYFRLEELCHQVTDGTHKTPNYQTSGVPFLSVKNVRPFLVRDADIKFISKEEQRLINSRCNPEKGDILYTKIGATFGYAAANKLDYAFSIFVSLALVKPVTPYFSSAFAELVLNSEVVFHQARERVSGIGTPDLHLVEIRDFRVPLPPIPEQKEIVRRVESLFALADRIEARFAEGQKRVNSIAQAILAKAFSGELVPTEFELAKAEGRAFESAEELLERIRQNGGQKGYESKSSR